MIIDANTDALTRYSTDLHFAFSDFVGQTIDENLFKRVRKALHDAVPAETKPYVLCNPELNSLADVAKGHLTAQVSLTVDGKRQKVLLSTKLDAPMTIESVPGNLYSDVAKQYVASGSVKADTSEVIPFETLKADVKDAWGDLDRSFKDAIAAHPSIRVIPNDEPEMIDITKPVIVGACILAAVIALLIAAVL